MNFEGFYNKALRFLSFRPRSEKEIRDNLLKKSRGGRYGSAKKEVDPGMINLVINKLKEQRFLDDKEFSKWWIEQRSLLNLKPKRVIKMELRQKGIDSEIIDELLNKVDDVVDDLTKAKKIVEKKLHKYKDFEGFEKRTRLGRFLASKGFNYDTIKDALKDL